MASNQQTLAHQHQSAPPDPNDRRIRVLIVDDHDLFREGLRQLLQSDHRLEVVGEAATGQEALSQVRVLQPDVVLMDITMPGMDGIRATEQIHELFPSVHIIMLTMHDNAFLERQARDAGARNYFVKHARSEELFQAIHHAAADGSALPSSPPITDEPVPPNNATLHSPSKLPEPANSSLDSVTQPVVSAPTPPAITFHQTDNTLPLLTLTEQEIEQMLNEQLQLLEVQLERVLAKRGLLGSGPNNSAPTAAVEALSSPSQAIESMQSPPVSGIRDMASRGVASPHARSEQLRHWITWVRWIDLLFVALAGGMLGIALGWPAIPPLTQLALGLTAAGLVLAGGIATASVHRAMRSTAEIALGLLVGAAWVTTGMRLTGLLLPATGLLLLWGFAALALSTGLWKNHEPLAGAGLAALLLTPATLPGPPLSVLALAALFGALVIGILISWRRRWSWVGLLALLAIVPQLSWATYTGQAAKHVLAVLAAFWLTEALVILGSSSTAPQRNAASTLLVSVATPLLVALIGMTALVNNPTAARGTFLAVLGLAQCGLCGMLIRHEGLASSRTILPGALGIGMLAFSFALAVPGPLATIGWAALAVLLAWTYGTYHHRPSGWGSLVLGALALGHLLLFDLSHALLTGTPASSLVLAEGVAIIAALCTVSLLVDAANIQAATATLAFFVAILVSSTALNGLSLLAVRAGLAFLATAVACRSWLGRAAWPLGRRRLVRISPLWIPAALAGGLALVQAFRTVLAPTQLGLTLLPAHVAVSDPSIAAAILATTVLAIGRITGTTRGRQAAIIVSTLIIAYTAAGELPNAPIVLGWCALVIALLALFRPTSA